jgi:WD40 repeat protein
MSSSIRRQILLSFLTGLILTACTQPPGAAGNSTTPIASAPTAVIIPTAAAPPEMTPTAALTVTPTAGPRPSSTPTESPVPNRRPVRTPTPLASGKPGLIVTLAEHRYGSIGPFSSAIPAFSPDGKMVALASERIRMWDLETHKKILDFRNPVKDCSVQKAAYSEDSRLLAVSSSLCWDAPDYSGKLVLWDAVTGSIAAEYIQESVNMIEPGHYPYQEFVDAFAFIPHSNRLAYGSGNTVIITEIVGGNSLGEQIVLDLGEKMFASEISTDESGDLLFVLMKWQKWNTHPHLYKTQYTLNIWDLSKLERVHAADFNNLDFGTVEMRLVGHSLVQWDYEKASGSITDLTREDVRDFPFRRGGKYTSSDASWMAVFRYFGFAPDEMKIEIWRTDSFRNPYNFNPDLGTDWYIGPVASAFSQDNTILAIAYREQLSLWNLSQVVNR